MEEEKRLTAMAEAILFAAGEPVEASRIAQTLGISEHVIPSLMQNLQERYLQTESALKVIQLEKAWQLGTKEEYSPVIRTAMETRRMQPLSGAAMEVLTIIAYHQPVSKGFIERGHMGTGGIFDIVLCRCNEFEFNLEGSISKDTGELGFGLNFFRHKVEEKNLQGANILTECACFGHNEDVFGFQCGGSG